MYDGGIRFEVMQHCKNCLVVVVFVNLRYTFSDELYFDLISLFAKMSFRVTIFSEDITGAPWASTEFTILFVGFFSVFRFDYG